MGRTQNPCVTTSVVQASAKPGCFLHKLKRSFVDLQRMRAKALEKHKSI